MTTEQLVVTGGGGRLAGVLRRVLPTATFLSRRALDVTDPGAVQLALRNAKAVVHLAAATDVDACERRPTLAQRVNVEGTGLVSSMAERVGAYLITISTDYVFDGSSPVYGEGDLVNPVNEYGRSKVAAERIVAEQVPHSLTIRTSWLFGEGSDSLSVLVRRAAAGLQIEATADEYGNPTSYTSLAESLVWALEHRPTGTYHVTGLGPSVSRTELMATALSAGGLSTRLLRSGTRPMGAAKRPRAAVLSTTKAVSEGFPMNYWREDLGIVEDLLAGGG